MKNTPLDKLKKVEDNFVINMYDNGYMVEVSGRDSEDDWARAKIIFSDIDSMLETIKEICNKSRSN
jgi:hypothetical protein